MISQPVRCKTRSIVAAFDLKDGVVDGVLFMPARITQTSRRGKKKRSHGPHPFVSGPANATRQSTDQPMRSALRPFDLAGVLRLAVRTWADYWQVGLPNSGRSRNRQLG
jgi:hypothetical protein